MQGHFLTVHIMEALCTPALDEILPAHVDPLSDLKLAGAATCLTVRASRTPQPTACCMLRIRAALVCAIPGIDTDMHITLCSHAAGIQTCQQSGGHPGVHGHGPGRRVTPHPVTPQRD